MIDAEKSVKSGPGTSMFSRSGASTIQQHKIFASKFNDINELITDARTRKKSTRPSVIGESNHVDDGTNNASKLPKISQNDEKSAEVEIPGLADEINKLEKSYKQKVLAAQNAPKRKSISQMAMQEEPSKSASNGFKISKVKEIDYDTLHKLTRAQFEEVTAAHFNSSRI